MFVFGFLMLVMPREFTKGEFESFRGAIWAEFTEANAKTGSFVELLYRAIGCMVLLIGIFKVFIALYPYRRAETWSWWTALIVGIIAWSFMFPYSVIIGAKNTLVFNIIGVIRNSKNIFLTRERNDRLSKKNYLLTSKQKDLFNFQLISRFRLI